MTCIAAPPLDATRGRSHCSMDDHPSSDATLWDGFASDLDLIVTPPIRPQDSSKARGVPAATPSPPREAIDATTGVAPQTDRTPIQNTDPHQQLLRELGWEPLPPEPASASVQQPRPSGSAPAAAEAPKSSFSIDAADVGAPWSQTGLYPTQYVRDQWLIGVGLKKPSSSGSARGSPPPSHLSTPPQERLEEVQSPSPGRLGLGQMRPVRRGPTTFVVPQSDASLDQAPITTTMAAISTAAASPRPRCADASPQQDGEKGGAAIATPRPRTTGGLLDQLDAQIYGFHRSASKDEALQRPTAAKAPLSASRQSDKSFRYSESTPAKDAAPSHSHRQSRSSLLPSGSEKENRPPRARGGATSTAEARKDSDQVVLCIDSDDEIEGGNPQRSRGSVNANTSKGSSKRQPCNAFDVLLSSPERNVASGPKSAGKGKQAASPSKVRFTASTPASSSRPPSPGKTNASQARLDLSVFRPSTTAPSQDRLSTAKQASSGGHQSINDANRNQTRRKGAVATGPSSSSEDSIGLKALEEQDWMLDLEEEDELRRIEAAIVAEPGPDSDPFLVDEDEGCAPGERQRRSAAAGPAPTATSRPRLTLPLRQSGASPAASSRRATIGQGEMPRASGSHASFEAIQGEGGGAGLKIRLISDLSQEAQQVYLRQLSGPSAKRKATDGEGSSGDSGQTRTRRSKGKAKTWDNTWAEVEDCVADDDYGDGDDDDDDDIEPVRASSARGRASGSGSRGRVRGSARSGAKATSSGSGGGGWGRSARGSGGKKGGTTSAYFAKRAWMAKRGRRR
ncbi:hypothetical protein ACQY0O_008276 [Thecaphora frezii]